MRTQNPHRLALKDFAAVAKAKPKSKDAQKKFKECEKLVNKMRFERALHVSEPSEKPLTVRLKEAARDSYI